MNIDRGVFALAGALILVSLLLSQLVHPAWLLFTAFIGLNLLQAAFTGLCVMAMILKKAGLKPGQAFPEA